MVIPLLSGKERGEKLRVGLQHEPAPLHFLPHRYRVTFQHRAVRKRDLYPLPRERKLRGKHAEVFRLHPKTRPAHRSVKEHIHSLPNGLPSVLDIPEDTYPDGIRRKESCRPRGIPCVPGLDETFHFALDGSFVADIHEILLEGCSRGRGDPYPSPITLILSRLWVVFQAKN